MTYQITVIYYFVKNVTSNILYYILLFKCNFIYFSIDLSINDYSNCVSPCKCCINHLNVIAIHLVLYSDNKLMHY